MRDCVWKRSILENDGESFKSQRRGDTQERVLRRLLRIAGRRRRERGAATAIWVEERGRAGGQEGATIYRARLIGIGGWISFDLAWGEQGLALILWVRPLFVSERCRHVKWASRRWTRASALYQSVAWLFVQPRPSSRRQHVAGQKNPGRDTS